MTNAWWLSDTCLTIWRQLQSWLHSKLERREHKTTQDKKNTGLWGCASKALLQTQNCSHIIYRSGGAQYTYINTYGCGFDKEEEKFPTATHWAASRKLLFVSNIKIGFTWSTVQAVHKNQHFTLMRLLESWVLISGQLISKDFFLVFKYSKKPTKYFTNFCASLYIKWLNQKMKGLDGTN